MTFLLFVVRQVQSVVQTAWPLEGHGKGWADVKQEKQTASNWFQLQSQEKDSHCWRSAAHKRFVQCKQGQSVRVQEVGVLSTGNIFTLPHLEPQDVPQNQKYAQCLLSLLLFFICVLHVIGLITLFTDGTSLTKEVCSTCPEVALDSHSAELLSH